MNESSAQPKKHQPLRVAAVSFLNARPLYHLLLNDKTAPRDEHGELLFEVQECPPSECAQRLADGECDLALVPVGSYAEHPEWEVVPGVGIGCRGEVETVVLAAEVPLEAIEDIYLDAASRSSILLLRLLLAQKGLSPRMHSEAHGKGIDRVQGNSAALIIGDAAFGVSERCSQVIDMGQWWFKETGLPFVFAFWAARPGLLTPTHVEALQQARDKGCLKYIERLSREYRNSRIEQGLESHDENHYANYLRKKIRYGLETQQREGLVEFLSQVHRNNLIDIPGMTDEDIIHVHFAGTHETEALQRARSSRKALDTEGLLNKAAEGGRLDLAEGIFLLEHADVMALGRAANRRREALHPDKVVTYIIDRNVNYTNVCVTRCQFCNFYTPPNSGKGYVLSKEELATKFRETEELEGIQILLQGGLNPALDLAYYEDLFQWTKKNFKLELHALSPTEIIHIAQIEDLSVHEVLRRLQAAGMDSLPGGGAEILDDEIRNRISPFKNNTEEWLEVMRQAHSLGMRSSATMVFGFQEHTEHILMHLQRLRDLQDESSGFTAFITWPFQAEGTRLKLRDNTSALRYLRIQALSRLFLDNIPNIQVSWPTLGPEIGEIALHFGANDFGSIMIEENVVSQAGAHFMMTSEEVERHIRLAGFSPSRRNMRYERLSTSSTKTPRVAHEPA